MDAHQELDKHTAVLLTGGQQSVHASVQGLLSNSRRGHGTMAAGVRNYAN